MLAFIKLKTSYLFVWLFGAIVFAEFNCHDSRQNRILALGSFIASALVIVLLQINSGSNYIQASFISNVELIRDVLTVCFGLAFSVSVRVLIEIIPHRQCLVSLNSIGTKFAAFSYTLYLTHMPILRLLEYLGAPKSTSVNITSITLYVCWLVIGLIIAYILFLLFEKNTPQVKKFLKGHIK